MFFYTFVFMRVVKWMQMGMILVVFLGAVGIPFYQHTCNHENEIVQSVFVPTSGCHEGHQKQEKPACCASDNVQKSQKEAVDEDCCSDEVSNWNFSFFSFQELQAVIDSFFKELNILDFLGFNSRISNPENEFLFSGNDPPLTETLSRLSYLCIWRL